jgi:hypothetical protein
VANVLKPAHLVDTSRQTAKRRGTLRLLGVSIGNGDVPDILSIDRWPPLVKRRNPGVAAELRARPEPFSITSVLGTPVRLSQHVLLGEGRDAV